MIELFAEQIIRVIKMQTLLDFMVEVIATTILICILYIVYKYIKKEK